MLLKTHTQTQHEATATTETIAITTTTILQTHCTNDGIKFHRSRCRCRRCRFVAIVVD